MASRAPSRRRTGLCCVVALLLLATACEGGSPGSPDVSEVRDSRAQDVPLDLAITPSDGSRGVAPDVPVVVFASGGYLTHVVMTGSDGQSLPGRLRGRGRVWTSSEPLHYSETYRVAASARSATGHDVERTVRFRTLKPRQVVDVSVAPLAGETVGVGMPVVVYFDEPVQAKAAVERGLAVRTSAPVEGAWSWVSDTEVHFRPREYWPSGTRVTVDLNLAGVHVAPGLWSDEDREVSFDIGPSMVSVVDVRARRMTVRRNGDLVRRIPVTTGKAAFLTRGGTKVVLEKHRVKVMDASTIGIGPGSSEYYRLRVEYALRVTWSGEFVHSAPWSVGSQGSVNVSHGCVGMSPAHAIWLFHRSRRGDIVEVVHSSRELEQGNGYTDWNVTWPEWRSGSALR